MRRRSLQVGVLWVAISLISACTAGVPTVSSSTAAPTATSAAKPVATTSNALPRQELPDCQVLARIIPGSVARRTTVERTDPNRTQDDTAHSARLCVIAGRSAEDHRRTFVIRVLRIFGDSYLGTPRQRYLLESTRSDVKNACQTGRYRLSGFEWSTACYQPADNGGVIRIGVVVSNTAVIVGGSGRFEDGESPTQLRERVKREFLAVTRAVLATVEP
jgi:hypothetical protein